MTTREKIAFFAVLVALLAARLIPEIQMGIFPVGFDTLTSYTKVLSESWKYTNLLEQLRSFNFLYYIFAQTKEILGGDAFLIIKTYGVLLYLFFNLSFYIFVRRVLNFNRNLALVGMLVFGLQLTTLRMSWDLYRNEFSLSLAFLAIWQFISFYRDRRVYNLILSILLAVLSIFSHQMVAVLFLILVGIQLFLTLSRGLFKKEYIGHSLVALFLVFWPFIARKIIFHNNVLWYGFDPLSFPTDLPSELFILLYLFLLPLVVIGLIFNSIFILNVYTLLILIQGFSILFFKVEGFFLWDRWLYFLIIPFIIYALYGIEQIAKIGPTIKTRPVFIYLLFSTPLLYPTVSFLLQEVKIDFGYKNGIIENHVPRTMVWGAIGQETSKSFEDCTKLFQKVYDGKSPVYADWIYEGLVYYYMPNLANKFHFLQYNTTVNGEYYVFGKNLKGLGVTKQIQFSTEGCPIYYHGLKARKDI